MTADQTATRLKGVVLAGGSGSRLQPLTLVTNKHILPVYDRPMIFYPLQTLVEMGVEEVLVILGGRSVGDVVELLQDGSAFGVRISYRYQAGAPGIAHAIGLARDFAGEQPVAVILGDNIIRGSLRDFAASFVRDDYDAGAVLTRVPDPGRFGVAAFNGDGRISRFDEKPERPTSDLIPIGVYLLRSSVFDVIERLEPSGRGELEVTDLLNHFLEQGRLTHHIFEGEWHDAGTIAALLESSESIARGAGTMQEVERRTVSGSQ